MVKTYSYKYSNGSVATRDYAEHTDKACGSGAIGG